MKYLGAGLDKAEGKKIHKAMCGGTMAATPISCCAGYTVINEIEKRNACQVAGQMADRLVKGLNDSIKKYDLPFVCYNVGSICQLHTVATMHFRIGKSLGQFRRYLKKQASVKQRCSTWALLTWQKVLLHLQALVFTPQALIPKRILMNASEDSTKFFPSAKRLITNQI